MQGVRCNVKFQHATRHRSRKSLGKLAAVDSPVFLDLGEGLIAFPVGKYQKTEQNLRKNGRIQLLVASKKVQGTKSPGQGCLITGSAEIIATGEVVDAVRVKFPWARGALVVRVEEWRTQL